MLQSKIIPLPVAQRQFIPPTIEEVLARSKEIDLDEIEAQRFHCYYESQGWHVGQHEMKVWRSALAGWKLRYDQRQSEKRKRVAEPTASVQFITWQTELKRVETRMASIRGSYSEHQSWSVPDRNLFGCLKKRRDELVKKLGMII